MTAPATYADALAVAESLYAAAQAPDPIDSLAATVLAAAQAISAASDAAGATITNLWQSVNPYSDSAVRDFAEAAGRILIPTQRAVAQLTAGAQTAQMRAAGVQASVPTSIPDDVRSAKVVIRQDTPEIVTHRRPKSTITYNDGSTAKVSQEASNTSRVFVRVAKDYRYTESQSDATKAQAAAEERILRLVDGNVQVTQRLVEEAALRSPRKSGPAPIGYRRLIHPELSKGGVCGMCVIAADRIYAIDELKAIHDRCKCTTSAVYDGYDPGQQLNGRDLSDLYDAAGGNTRDLLKRTRYTVQQHSELGPILVPQKGSPVPYFTAGKPRAVDATPKGQESSRSVAERHLPALRASLKALREKGLAEDSSPVQYHLAQIAKFEAALKKAA
ncbi:hypothetical protein [Nocardia spumae]|uniref:hypothetical protein n=1 Tax=Nocardia spumae TaxID=2887190 RepID=UPI001D1546D9|nr:hypothetical protein [Nocardia spumae]